MPINSNIPMSFQPPQMESPGNMMARMAQMQAYQDSSEDRQLAIAQRKRLLDEQGQFNALLRKNNNEVNEEVLGFMAGASAPEMRKAGLEGLQELGYRKAFLKSLEDEQPSMLAARPQLPPMQNFLSPQENFESAPLTMGNAPQGNQLAPPVSQRNLLIEGKSYGDPVLRALYDKAQRYEAAMQTSGGKYADRAKELLENTRKEIDHRLKAYEAFTANAGDTRFRADPITGKPVEVARGPDPVSQMIDRIAQEQDPRVKAILNEKLATMVSHPPTLLVGQTGATTAVRGPATPGGAYRTEEIKTPTGEVPSKPSAQLEAETFKKQKIQQDISRAVPGLQDAIKPNGLLDQATAGAIGSGVDTVVGWTGASLPGARATAKLKILADPLVKMIPRFEGPQSKEDADSYRQAAGDLGNSNLPRETRRAAAVTLLKLFKQYQGQFDLEGVAAPAAAAPAATSGTTVVQPPSRQSGGGQWSVKE